MRDTLQLTVSLLAGPLGLALAIGGVIAYIRGRRRIAVPAFSLILLALFAFTLATRWRTFERWFTPDIDNAARKEQLSAAELKSSEPTTGDWPQWRGQHRDGIGLAPKMSADWNHSPPTVSWTTAVGKGYSSCAIVQDRLYTQDYRDGNERVICLNAATGAEIWKLARPVDYGGFRAGYANGPRATPTVHDGRVYTVGATGIFLCLDAEKSTVLWEHDLRTEFNAPLPQWGFASSPLLEGDLVIVQPGGTTGSIAAFDRVAGNKVWSALDDLNGYSSPVAATIAGIRQIIAFTGDRVVGLRVADGHLLWSYEWPTEYHANIATPIAVGDQVFISSGYNKGCALLGLTAAGDGMTVEPIWQRSNKLLRTHHMTCVRKDEFLFGFDDGRAELKCVNLRDGSEVWASNKVGKGCVILADGHLIVLSQNGDLALVEATPAEFRLKGKLPNVLSGAECWALPALANGRLYLRDHEKVVSLKIE